MTVKAIVEKGTDGSYDVRTEDEAPVDYMVLGEGNTVEKAIEDFYVSYGEIKAFYLEKGKPFTEIKSFDFIFDLPAFLQYYSKVFSYAALERVTGVSQAQLSQYVQGYRRPSKKTAKKIEEKLHSLAKELQQVQFV